MRQIAAIILFVVAQSFLLPTARAQTAGKPFEVAGVSHGVRISLTLPRHSYPRDALITATITLHNVSRDDRYLPDWPPNWGGPHSPHIRMRTTASRLIYQEQLSDFLTPTPGSSSDTYILRPGASLTRHVRFVLQAEQVQAVALVADGYTSFSTNRAGTPTVPDFRLAQGQCHVTSPFATVALTAEPPPALTVTRLGPRRGASIHLTVRPPWSVHGAPFFMDSSYCATGASMGFTDQQLPWTVMRGDQVTMKLNPQCRTPQRWRLVVGWPDHRVAYFDSRHPAAQP